MSHLGIGVYIPHDQPDGDLHGGRIVQSQKRHSTSEFFGFTISYFTNSRVVCFMGILHWKTLLKTACNPILLFLTLKVLLEESP